jgi:Xaa-Pro aminopeptidase
MRKRKSPTEIERLQRFGEILADMTPRQIVLLRDYMADLEAGRSTAKSEAKLRAAFR